MRRLAVARRGAFMRYFSASVEGTCGRRRPLPPPAPDDVDGQTACADDDGGVAGGAGSEPQRTAGVAGEDARAGLRDAGVVEDSDGHMRIEDLAGDEDDDGAARVAERAAAGAREVCGGCPDGAGGLGSCACGAYGAATLSSPGV
jgi:hypothetical protein